MHDKHDKASGWFTCSDCHLEGTTDQRRRHGRRHGPANDFAEEQLEHDRQIHPARTGADISDIRCLRLIGVSTGIRPLHKNASTMAGV